MAVIERNDELVEVAVADDNMIEAAAVDIAAALGQKQDRRIHQQLLIAVGFT